MPTPRMDKLDADLIHDADKIVEQKGSTSDLILHIVGNYIKHGKELETELQEAVANNKALRDALSNYIQDACQCDAMLGHTCGVHNIYGPLLDNKLKTNYYVETIEERIKFLEGMPCALNSTGFDCVELHRKDKCPRCFALKQVKERRMEGVK